MRAPGLLPVIVLASSGLGDAHSIGGKQQSLANANLIQNDWATLASETTIRYFHPSHYQPGASEEEIWEMGQNITCHVADDLTVSLQVPADFDSINPFKFMTHGFSSSAIGGKTAFVPTWMEAYNKQVNVVLVDWKKLAFFGQVDGWDNYFYDLAARNSIDVGEYLGRCLAALTAEQGVISANIHLAGHSLGSHLMGKAGRVYKSVVGQGLARVTGLDPAGPRFVDGPLVDAIPELHENRLSPESAELVDVIHTNGALEPAVVWIDPHSGDLHQLGHMDFYPSGGSAQPGCQIGGVDGLPGGVCSHRRAYFYYIHSIREPELFPSFACSSVDECNQGIVHPDQQGTFMGEKAQDGSHGLFYLDIMDDHWDYDTHNKKISFLN